MIPAIKEIMRQGKQQYQIKRTSSSYEQNSLFIYIL